MDANAAAWLIGAFIVGGLFGAVLVWFARDRAERRLMATLDAQRRGDEMRLVETLRGIFGTASQEALAYSARLLVQIADQQLGGRAAVIDHRINDLNAQLSQALALVRDFEAQRGAKLGALGSELGQLAETTGALARVLGDNRQRGQWGERMADDILRAANFRLNVHYTRQTSIDALDGRRTRPDYTFLLPNGKKLNMDVKFPLTNYMASLRAETPAEQAALLQKFFKDVRSRLTEIGGREYINDETVNCVLIFIPNDAIYGVIQEGAPEIFEIALKLHIALCAPATLYAVLGVLYQAAENFVLQQSAVEILKLLEQFYEQWGHYSAKLDEMGRRLDEARKAYRDLTETRARTLEAPLREIDALRQRHNLPGGDAAEQGRLL